MRVIPMEGVRGFAHDDDSAVVPRISQGGDPSYQEMSASNSVGLFNDLYFFGR